MALGKSKQSSSFFNRRKHQRNPVKQTVLLRYFDDNGHCIQENPKPAETVNLSSGGMQISLPEPLMNETIIHFSLNKSSSPAARKGLARVAWCRYEEEEKNYIAGLSFHTSPSRHPLSQEQDKAGI
jgi:hypothetical protein